MCRVTHTLGSLLYVNSSMHEYECLPFLFLFNFASPDYNKIRASEFNHFRIGMAGELCSMYDNWPKSTLEFCIRITIKSHMLVFYSAPM